jgi:hypothetical protein
LPGQRALPAGPLDIRIRSRREACDVGWQAELRRPLMTARTSHSTVTFTRPFFLEIVGLSFSAYRRVATMMILPARPGTGVGQQIATIDPLELQAAQERDVEPGAAVISPAT